MDESILRAAGHRLYVTSRLKEMKRYLVFRARCRMHKDIIEDVLDFFAATELRKRILEGTPSFIEQVTRAFFYKGSDYPDRAALVKNHILFMEKHFTPESIAKLYAEADENTNSGKRLTLWEDVFEDRPLRMNLLFYAGQRKEGKEGVLGHLPYSRHVQRTGYRPPRREVPGGHQEEPGHREGWPPGRPRGIQAVAPREGTRDSLRHGSRPPGLGSGIGKDGVVYDRRRQCPMQKRL